MSDENNEEKHFTLDAMKFVFELCDTPFPDKYQRELDCFDENNPTCFTDEMKQAVIFIHGDFFFNRTSPDDIDSEEYNKTLEKLEQDFDIGKFLKFMAWNLLISILENSEEKIDRVQDDIINILKSKAPISESWVELDEIASKYIKNVDVENRSLNDTGFCNISMVKEKNFLLKLIDYVFVLHFRALPERLECKVNNISPYKNDPFTNNVTHALAILINNQLEVIEKIGEEGLVKYYFDSNLSSFNERDFLEFCVSQCRKTYFEYFLGFRVDSPWATYKRMKRMLKSAKMNGSFTTWDKMEEAALQIIKEDTERREEELLYQEICKGKSGVVYEDYETLRRLSDSDKSLQKFLVNQEEVAVVNALVNSSQSLEEALETTLLIENKKNTCSCCNCS